MNELSESRLAETTAPLVLGWGLGETSSPPSSAEPSIADPSIPTGKIDLSFRLGDPDDASRGGNSFEATRSVAPSAPEKAKAIRFPSDGDIVGGFRIVSELGRGAFARVYVAEQEDLAGRPVALKVAEALGDEPQALAKLQHTHIVPIYSVHTDPVTGLRLLCMPYVGGANLAQVLEQSGARSPTQTAGRSLIEALDHVGCRAPTRPGATRVDSPSENAFPFHGAATGGHGSPSAVRSVLGRYWAKLPWWKSLEGSSNPEAIAASADPDDRDQPARRYLRSHSYVQAAAWITARLAEGLDHAHARGILHRDLKPSNILIAGDGTPMLLDFNLAADTQCDAHQENGERARLGGTLPYMAPEHLDAFNPMGSTEVTSVDERSDIYALGLILYEMLAGRHAFDDPPSGLAILQVVSRMTEERRQGASPPRLINPSIPPSLDAIVMKALRPDPAQRYARAGEMAEDLQRFLDDRPNAFAPEPSLKERCKKWYRRHPKVRGAGPVAALACAVLLIGAGIAWSIHLSAESAKASLQRTAFREDFMQCQLLLNTSSGLASHRKEGIARANALLKLYGVNGDTKWLESPMVTRLPAEDRLTLKEDISELMLLLARARVKQVEKSTEPIRRKVLGEAITLLNRAELTDPKPSSALFETRSRFYAALGESAKSRLDLTRSESTPATSARDYYLRGTDRAALGDLDRAEEDLGHAVALDPHRFWAWFVLGLCHFDRNRYSEAVGDFNVCTLIAPEFAWSYLNRGLALSRSDRPTEARYSYDHALQLTPDFIEALVNRALVCLELDDPAQAERDLARVIALGRRDAGTLSARAEALARMGRRDQAERDFENALAIRPNDARVLVARGVSRINEDPDGAASDFETVLKRDSRNVRALYGLALLLRHTDRKAAIDHASRALDADPNALDVLRLRAVLRGREGDLSAAFDADRLARSPSSQNLYNAACALSLLDAKTGSSQHRLIAREYLQRALDLGFPRLHADADPDLASIRR